MIECYADRWNAALKAHMREGDKITLRKMLADAEARYAALPEGRERNLVGMEISAIKSDLNRE